MPLYFEPMSEFHDFKREMRLMLDSAVALDFDKKLYDAGYLSKRKTKLSKPKKSKIVLARRKANRVAGKQRHR